MMESFWSSMQIELLDRQQWKTRVELANAIIDYLEIFYNRQRRQVGQVKLSPIRAADPYQRHNRADDYAGNGHGPTRAAGHFRLGSFNTHM